ncbi:hypothetical protein H9X57_15320 [Flavobacterium piscinae]|uniref:hypothetical protein n=1 Tax=Flavobacterium piscinae TaxID=2506424 RepID=UPI0019CBB291|nr:hypothetical protein [Flavobacterium piscinae]MBC8884242.1 hypothetical protein [Flavobacterium piscinae]
MYFYALNLFSLNDRIHSNTIKVRKKKSFQEEITLNTFSFDFTDFAPSELQSFDVKIVFKESIILFRNNDYKWVSCDKERIANEFCPKIIKLDNGFFVQPNINYGIWEINPTHPKILYWRFNPENSNPITQYIGKENAKKLFKPIIFMIFMYRLGYFFRIKTPLNSVDLKFHSLPLPHLQTIVTMIHLKVFNYKENFLNQTI